MDLSPADEHHLNAAEGWLDLDDPVEAATELDAIGLANLTHPSVLLLHCRLYLAIHRAEYTFDIATTLTDQLPESPDAWFYLACACSRLGQNELAASALTKCFLAAERTGSEKEWQERALGTRDLEPFCCANQTEL